MRRRRYLALSSTAFAALVAGCSGGDGDDDDQNGNDDDQNGNDDDQNGTEDGQNGNDDDQNGGGDENVDSFREALEAEGYDVLDLREDDGIVTLDYTSDAEDDEAIVDEAGPIMEAFADELDGGWEVEWLEVWLIHDDGSTNASYEVMASTVADWNAGEISDEEFYDQIREKISSA